MRDRGLRCIIAGSILVTYFAAVVSGRESRTEAQANSSRSQSKTTEEVYRNIQVLKGIPASQLAGAMQFMTASLGVACTFCHSEKPESDEKSAKQTARQMLVMTRDLNKTYFSGLEVVNCYTCHKGSTEPSSRPSISSIDRVGSVEHGSIGSKERLPSADELLSHHLSGTGGEVAVDKLKSIVARGSEVVAGPDSEKGEVEVWRKAPDKLLKVVTSASMKWRMGVEGDLGWEAVGNAVRQLDGEELEEAMRAAAFFRFLKIKEAYPRMVVLETGEVNGRKAYVAGASGRDGERARLYFDADSGLLLRKAVEKKTVLGSMPEITDFEDYRDVAGIKLPFKIIEYKPPVSTTILFSRIEVNVSVDDKEFKLPRGAQ